MFKEPPFTLGIEEEYLLVNKETRAVTEEAPEALFEACQKRLKGRVAHEFLSSQIEVNTNVCTDITAARAELSELRSTIAEVAGEYGLAPIAASTHPFSLWESQHHTDKERYNEIARDIQAPVRRLMICGMHVHVGLGDDDELRIDLLNQVSYFLPHMLAFSTSSPFWRGLDAGLKSYRLSVFDEMPRTGIPNQFQSFSEYERHVAVLVKAGLIEDATKLWWDVRPSARFPTLEMRIADVCTLMDDALAVAALFACILRMLYRLKTNNQRWRVYSQMLIEENRWRAQRYGTDEGLVDFGKGEVVPFGQLIDEITSLIDEDVQALGCTEQIAHLKTILARGTSAHRQVKTYEDAVAAGADRDKALIAVVDRLIAETADITKA
ncbi:MAG: carboxylate-amine ligase [Rhodospirillales bacterium]